MSPAKRARRGLAIRSGAARLGPPEPAPLAAGVLALDVAKTTGAALYLRGVLCGFDEVRVDDPNARRALLREALDATTVRALTLACVVETPYGGYVSAALSLTASVALWRDSWRALGQPAERFIALTVGEWRRGLFGRKALSREQARAWEARVAGALRAQDLPRVSKPCGPDAAAAICLGSVAVRSSTVRKALGCALTKG